MRIAILGCGGVGGYYGGKLAHFYSGNTSVEVIFIARGKHLGAIRTHGLKVFSPSDEFTAHPAIAADATADLGVFDMILVCVKNYDIEAALDKVKINVGKNTVIIPLMNGIEGYEITKNKFPEALVMRGACYLNAFVEEPGVIRFRGGSEQVLIGYADDAVREEAQQILSAAGLDVFSAADVLSKVWEKFLFVSVLSGIGSLENESFGEIAASAERMELAGKMMNELCAIAVAKEIGLPQTIGETVLAKIPAFPAEARTSMQRDFVNGKQTELETFIGYVVRTAAELNLEAPEYKKVYTALISKQRSVIGNL
jgi:2-dehydropantoate 2-reductase